MYEGYLAKFQHVSDLRNRFDSCYVIMPRFDEPPMHASAPRYATCADGSNCGRITRWILVPVQAEPGKITWQLSKRFRKSETC